MIRYSKAMTKTWSHLGSCGAFGLAAMELPNINDKVVMLTSDLCFYSGLTRFQSKYPEHLYNLGIAEQNMVGVAGGMAKEGLIPFATTYGTFASMRCADQVRVVMGYMNLGVKLVGLTSGLSVGILGPTHIALEDIAVMRTIPNVTILSPADCTETVKATIAAAEYPGPVYLRLTGTMHNPIVYEGDYDFEIGKSIKLREGDDISIIATGTMVYHALKAAELLEESGISAEVIDMHTIVPIDKQQVCKSAGKKMLVTVEEHGIRGGLGAAVAETLAEEGMSTHQLMIGTKNEYLHAASYEYLMKEYGLDVPTIVKKILDAYQKVG